MYSGGRRRLPLSSDSHVVCGNISQVDSDARQTPVVGSAGFFVCLAAILSYEEHSLIMNTRELQQRYLAGQRNFENADLRGAQLQDLTLAGIRLRNADLRGADLSGASLWGADLAGASLEGASLRGTDLRRASLVGSDLQCSDLTYALLVSADLTGAILRGANFSHADLYCAQLSPAQHNAALEAGAHVYDPALSDLRHAMAFR